MRSSWMMGAIGVLSTTAILQVIGLALSPTAQPPAAGEPYVGAERGARPDVKVVQAGTAPVPLSDIEAGFCRYVVIVSPTCAASIATARTWQQARKAEGGVEVPDGWRVIWVGIGDSAASQRVFQTGSADPIWIPAESNEFMEELKIRVFPAHLILDRSGNLVSGDVGAQLLPATDYRDDCSIISRPGKS